MTSVHPITDVRIFSKECQSLASAGYDTSLVVPEAISEKKKGVKIKGVTPFKNGRFFRMTITVWRVFRAALKEHAHIYHFHDPELIPIGLLLRILGKKVIYDVHEDYPLNIQTRFWLPSWMRKLVSCLFRCLENFSAKYLNCIVSATPAIAKKFKSINKNTVIVQNFPQLEELYATEKELSWDERYDSITYIGGIDISLGIKEMVKAMELVQRKSNAKLILGGEFSPKSLKEEIQNFPGWKNVEYRGFVDRQNLAKLLKMVKAGLVLLHPEPHYMVAYPTKLFEYMSAAIPVIASDFPLWRNIVDGAECGLLVNPLNPQSIADSIIYILQHPEEAERMGKNGRKAVEELYNWSNEEKKLLQLYEDLLK